MENFICPIVQKEGYANGFFITWPSSGKTYLLTSAHVLLNRSSSFLLYDEKLIKIFNPDDGKRTSIVGYNFAIGYEVQSFCDFAIIEMDIDFIKSPLMLSTKKAKINEHLDSISYKVNKIDNIFTKNISYNCELYHSDAVVTKKSLPVAVHCTMTPPLEEGRSGSPILKGNKVYGVLSGGNNGSPCVYTSSIAILKYLKRNNIVL